MNIEQILKLLDQNEQVAFVVGNPISHSLSPLMHTTAAQELGLSLKYERLKLEIQDLLRIPKLFNHESFIGANITIPYKEQIVNFVDEVDELAASVGAVNTISKDFTTIIGHNTDVFGFMSPLMPYSDELEGATAIVFGTGGASRAVVYALEELGLAEVIIVSRNPGIQIELNTNLNIVMASYANWHAYASSDCMLIVNTTPLGMGSFKDDSPIKDFEVNYLEGRICYDLVYGKDKTPFIIQAIENGGFPIDGLEMLIHQGSKAFEIWTGKPFPTDTVRKTLINHIRS
jgi:shikimate dehydrogenase